MSISSKKIILTKRPSGELVKECFSIVNHAVPNPVKNEIRVKTLFFSVDPYMRNRMNDVPSYITPYHLNEPIEGDSICQVTDSEHPGYEAGDIIAAMLPWQEYAVLSGDQHLEKIEKSDNIDHTTYLGLLGLTGLTAYFGMLDIADPQEGENVVISGAAGAVGSVAGQIAKLKGCRVIGITGSVDKADLLKRELGFDGAIVYPAYKNIRKPLRELCPDGIDIYFDNVGGQISDAVFYQINTFARIVLCGQISLYNQNRLVLGPRLLAQLIIHRARMQGFIVYDYIHQFPAARNELKKWLLEGKLLNKEQIVNGFENLPDALISLFRGTNTGKLIVKV